MIQITLSNVNTTGRVNSSQSGIHYMPVVRNVNINNNGNWEKQAQFIDVQFAPQAWDTIERLTAKVTDESKYKICLDITCADLKVSKDDNGNLKLLTQAVAIDPAPRGADNPSCISITRCGLTKDMVLSQDGTTLYATVGSNSFLSGGNIYFEVAFEGEAKNRAESLKLKKGSQIALMGITKWSAYINQNGYPTVRLIVTDKNSVQYASTYKKANDSQQEQPQQNPQGQPQQYPQGQPQQYPQGQPQQYPQGQPQQYPQGQPQQYPQGQPQQYPQGQPQQYPQGQPQQYPQGQPQQYPQGQPQQYPQGQPQQYPQGQPQPAQDANFAGVPETSFMNIAGTDMFGSDEQF